MKHLIIFILSLLITINSFSQTSERKIKIIYIAEYSPTDSGIISRSEVFENHQTEIIKFDMQNNMKERYILNPSTKENKILHKYLNYKGQTATLMETYNNENELTSYRKYVLNSFNKPDTTYFYSASNELFNISIDLYDSNKNLKIKIDSNFVNNRSYKTEYEFNSLNEMTKEISFDINGMITHTTSFRYNEHGDLTNIIWHDKEGSITTQTKFVYEYDEFNNWITQKTSKHDQDISYIFERKIEYFD